jgi:hypothetical protein
MPKKRNTEPTTSTGDHEPDFEAFAAEYGDAVVEKLRRVMAANPESLKAWTKDDIEEIAGAIDEDEMHPRQTLRRLVNRLRGRLKMKHPQGYAAYLPEPLQKGLDAATQPPPDASGGDEPWTQLEMDILEALRGKALTGEGIGRAIRREFPTVRDALKTNAPLRRSGKVANKRGVGYYRTDAPPQDED